MIVRCTNCVSAFAVDDDKVANRKFAFTCPKCGNENIFDNRKQEKKPAAEELFFEEDKDVSFEEPAAKGHDFEHDLGSEDTFFEEPAAPARKDKNLNLEIEETSGSDEILFEEDELFADEKPSKKAAPAEEEISFDDDIFLEEEKPAKKAAAADEEISFDDDIFLEEEEPAKKAPPADEEISFDEEIFLEEEEPVKKAAPADEEITFDDDIFLEDEKPAKKAAPADEEISFDDDIFLEEEKPAKKAAPADEEITFDEEIFLEEEEPVKKAAPADEEITFDEEIFLEEEEPVKKAAPADEEILFNDDFIIDESESPEELKKKTETDDELADIGLELDIESEASEKSSGDRDVKISSQDDIDAMFADLPAEDEISVQGKPAGKGRLDDDITVNLDELDIELEEGPSPSKDDFVAFDDSGEAKTGGDEQLFDDDITIDMDSLDIDIEDAGDFHRPEKAKEENPEEELSLNIDEFGSEFESEKPVKKRADAAPEDDITLDLDSLDIELDEGETPAPPARREKETEFAAFDESADEDLKLNLDEMDVNIEALENQEIIFDEEIFAETKPKGRKSPLIEEPEEDESITIDLESLDIEVAESPEILTGEMAEEDEKLTLDDAGLTFSELAEEERNAELSESEEEELSLTLEEIDPDLKLQVIGEEAPEDEKPLVDTIDELPEIDLDEYDAVIREEKLREKTFHEEEITGLDEFDTLEIPLEQPRARDLDILDFEEEAEESYTPEKGSTAFSIDYSLKYSRLGAVLRLFGLYILSMIPHFIIMLIYTILSGILGFINQIVILSTGRCVEDFSQITENTLRYFLYIKSNITGIVEDRPVYAGRESISHQMQLNVTYPVKYSRNLAILRLSVIGIWIITLPHFIIMAFLTLAVPVVYLAGILAVIATRRWPNPLFIFLTRYFRYLARISSFLLGLTDEYPSFRFD